MPVNGLSLLVFIILLVIVFSVFFKKIENYFVFFPQDRLDFTPRDWADAPISHALVEQLASLPQLGIGDVMVLKGSGRLTRSAVRRLS